MTNGEIKSAIDDHKLWLDRRGGQRADLCGEDLWGENLCDADLRGANLRDAHFCGANLWGAKLCEANLWGANLWGAKLCEADLCGANLWGAKLCEADLRGANLCGANLLDADLRGANLDFSGWPLHCGSLSVKIDARIAAQLVYHAVRACQSVTDDDGVVAFCKSPDVIALANRFHRVDECGRIGEAEKAAGESEVAK